MSINAIYELMDCYTDKMVHPVPKAQVIDRGEIVQRFRGKRVLDIGSSGNMGDYIKTIANVTSVDRENADYCIDVEKDDLPDGEFDFVFCGETLEHLSNPGTFLDKLYKYDCPTIITVPNAFCEAGNRMIRKGIENVNKEHVSWYSYHTLNVLIERHGFKREEFYWYNGEPLTAEGIVFVVRRRNGCT